MRGSVSGTAFRIFWLEIKEFSLVANQDEAERRKIVGVFFKSRAGQEWREFWLVVRAEMAASFKVVKNTRQMRKLVHLEVSASVRQGNLAASAGGARVAFDP